MNWLVVSNIFYFHPYLGKIPNLTNIFQMGWNHQLVKHSIAFVDSPAYPDPMIYIIYVQSMMKGVLHDFLLEKQYFGPIAILSRWTRICGKHMRHKKMFK